VRLVEAPAEFAGRRGIGYPLRPQGIQIHLIVAPQFQVFQASAARQQVVSHVQHMVGFAVRQVDLEQVQLTIDCLIQTKLTNNLVNHPDATGGDGTRSIRDLIVNARARKHRTLPDMPRLI